MSFPLKPAAIAFMVMAAALSFAGAAGAAGVVGVYPFQDTGATPASHYGNGGSLNRNCCKRRTGISTALRFMAGPVCAPALPREAIAAAAPCSNQRQKVALRR